MHDQFDVTLEDADLLGEVELTTNLIIAASEADEHMTTAEIDRILGVRPRRLLTPPCAPRFAGAWQRTPCAIYPRGVG